MFREYNQLVEESVNEGVTRGVQMFLDSLNQDLALDQISEGFEYGVNGVIAKLFEESGYSVTPYTEEELQEMQEMQESAEEYIQESAEVIEESDVESRIDSVLRELQLADI